MYSNRLSCLQAEKANCESSETGNKMIPTSLPRMTNTHIFLDISFKSESREKKIITEFSKLFLKMKNAVKKVKKTKKKK